MRVANFLEYIEPYASEKEKRAGILLVSMFVKAIEAVPEDTRKRSYFTIARADGLGFAVLGKN